MPVYQISETCSCGAKFDYSERVDQSYHRQVDSEHKRFLAAHEACRVKAVITNGKELKMFLATTKSVIDAPPID